MEYNKELAAIMLNKLHHLRKWGVRKKAWRRTLADWNIKYGHFTSEDFIKTWDYLNAQGLIRR